ncbi:MATE family efflux transporter [Aliivibrio fischeri]|nr:MATE family efflux transporter [Aliivibrio fischeri]
MRVNAVNKSLFYNVRQHANREFFYRLFVIAFPITLQSILFSSKSLIDVFMLGQLSEADIAAVGVGSRAIFFTTIILTGITTTGALLAAQHWGAKDNKGLRETTALTWLTSTCSALVIVFLLQFFASFVMQLASKDPSVIALGVEYIQITSWSMLAVAFTASLGAGFRSIQQPGISTFFSGIGIVLNILLNWLLIFGYLGFPALGIKGAAIATVVSSIIEVGLLYLYLLMKSHLLKFGLKEIIQSLQVDKFRSFIRLALPTTTNFLLWAGGLFAYTAIMGQTGTEGLAAFAVVTPIEAVSLSFLMGIANASGVLVGNHIGAKEYDKVYYQAMLMMIIGFVVTIAVSFCLFLSKSWILDLFTALTPETRELADTFVSILCIGIVLRSIPTTLVVGILRAGGDVKFCLYQDVLTQWFFGIPIAALGAVYFGYSAEVIYSLFFLETLFKWFASIYRLKSKKWINNLVEAKG